MISEDKVAGQQVYATLKQEAASTVDPDRNACLLRADDFKKQLQRGIRVPDSGCGPELWSVDMSKEYSQSSFIGLDCSNMFSIQGSNPPNVTSICAVNWNFISLMQGLLTLKCDWHIVIHSTDDAFKPFLLESHPELKYPRKYNKFLTDTAQECQEFKPSMIIYRSYGQKPQHGLFRTEV
ncbi:hypothetical protein BJV82DRAFT_576781 [Fennellomyces sp. T-0311]|nr:hypothetical protein BJV82DRAFT_576781 [Fennellomyces sp. T-0311]